MLVIVIVELTLCGMNNIKPFTRCILFACNSCQWKLWNKCQFVKVPPTVAAYEVSCFVKHVW